MAVDAGRAKSIFLAASDLADPAECAALLDRECGGNAELRARVEALLRANDAAPLPAAGGATDDSAPGQPETEDYGDPTARVGAILGGKYKLVEEIGEGGMGSVFMAQQTEPVKRAVAVKVIKAGMDSKAVLARFEAERQALAMMDHPNIAKVLDAGTTEGGRPFFVMELVKGTPITRYCDEHKLTPRQRLELFVPVCQAIQHAHQKGIIHRDIKPSNVLVAMYDDRPMPKVIDFGVAKAAGQSLTDKTLMTGFGALVGTPEYMSPEQASLNNLDIDTRSDVYSLGVLLYELLTGTTPVDKKSLGKAAVLEILRIVREVEAPRPSAKLSSIDTLPSVAANRGTEPAKLSKMMRRELDWLVLKALEKDRSRRYETANALSRDIQRYLADEVVEARPPSVAYRVSKFVRRHKGQVIAASLVLFALVGGIVGTTLGLFEAWRQEQIARDETSKKEKALRAEAEAHAGLAKANDNLLSVGARGLLRPLAAQVLPKQPLPPLNDQEVEPLWELAATTDERLRLRFVELALNDRVLRRRLKDRAPFALQAAVGLDQTRRTHTEELLGKRLQAGKISPEEQEQVALCLAHLGGLERRLAGRTAATLIQVMSKTTDPNDLQSLGQSLSAVAARLEPMETAEVADALSQALSKTKGTNFIALRNLAQDLAAVSVRLGPKEAAKVAATLTQAMTKTTDFNALPNLAQGLSAVSARLDPKEAAKVAAALTQAMSKSTHPSALHYLGEALSAVAARLEPKEASHLCGQAAVTLIQALSKQPGDSFLMPVLSAAAARLEPKEAAEVAATLTQLMSKTTYPFGLRPLAEGLSAVAARLEAKEASQVCGQAAATLIQAMRKATDPRSLRPLEESLLIVAARLEPKKAAQLCRQAAFIFTQAISKTTDPFTSWSLADSLSKLTAPLEPKEAAQLSRQAAATFAQAINKTTNPNAWRSLAHGLSAVTMRLEPKEAAQLCGPAAATFTQAISKTTDLSALEPLAQGLSEVAARLDPKEAAAILTQAMRKTTRPNALQPLVRALSAVAARLEPKEAAATLTQVMSKTTESFAVRLLAEGLSAVSTHLEPKEAAQLCGQAAATLMQAMSMAVERYDLVALAHGLSAVSARLEPAEASRLCGRAATTLIRAMSNTRQPFELVSFFPTLSALSAHLEPKEAAELAAALIQVTSKIMDRFYFRFIARNISAVLARELPPQTLVDLLKHPLCVGEARRLVLDQLARHYRRPFADQWDFVDYVQQQRLPLDLTTPPVRSKMLP